MVDETLEQRVETRRRALERALDEVRTRAVGLALDDLDDLDRLNQRIETLQRQLSRSRYLLRHGWSGLEDAARTELGRWLLETEAPKRAAA